MTVELGQEHLKSAWREGDMFIEKNHQVHLLRIYPRLLFTSLLSNRQGAKIMQLCATKWTNCLKEEKQVCLCPRLLKCVSPDSHHPQLLFFTLSATFAAWMTHFIDKAQTFTFSDSSTCTISKNLHQVCRHLQVLIYQSNILFPTSCPKDVLIVPPSPPSPCSQHLLL